MWDSSSHVSDTPVLVLARADGDGVGETGPAGPMPLFPLHGPACPPASKPLCRCTLDDGGNNGAEARAGPGLLARKWPSGIGQEAQSQGHQCTTYQAPQHLSQYNASW